jgi:hypothetical protein
MFVREVADRREVLIVYPPTPAELSIATTRDACETTVSLANSKVLWLWCQNTASANRLTVFEPRLCLEAFRDHFPMWLREAGQVQGIHINSHRLARAACGSTRLNSSSGTGIFHSIAARSLCNRKSWFVRVSREQISPRASEILSIGKRDNRPSMGVAVLCLLPDAQPPFVSLSSPTPGRRSGARSCSRGR